MQNAVPLSSIHGDEWQGTELIRFWISDFGSFTQQWFQSADCRVFCLNRYEKGKTVCRWLNRHSTEPLQFD